MCGLVGYVGSNVMSDRASRSKVFSELLYAGTFRGDDSTGIAAACHNKDHVTGYKKAMAGHDFVQMAKATKIISNIDDYNVVMGHNRAATRGGVSDDTAHPFTYGHITLAHNGTISNHRQLTGGSNFVVDSEAIAYAVSKDGIDAVVKEIDGAFALTYIDKSDNTFNIVRNDERPMAIAKIKMTPNATASYWFYASEVKMLEWVISRNKFIIEEVFYPEKGELFIFKLDDTSVFTKRDLELKKFSWVQPWNSAHRQQPAALMSPTSTAVNENVNENDEKRARRHDENLKLIGLRKGQQVDFVPVEWTPYLGKPEKGWIEGYLTTDKYYQVRVYDVHTLYWDHIKEQEEAGEDVTMRGVCVNVHIDPKAITQSILVLEDAALVEDIEAKKQENQPDLESDLLKEDGTESSELVVEGAGGVFITLTEFKRRTKQGCGWCSEQVRVSDAKDILWTNGGFVCPSCRDNFNSSYGTAEDYCGC